VRFVLEEASWAWDGADRAGYVERIEQLLDRLDVARERGEGYATSRELLEQKIVGDFTLAALFWDSGSPLALEREVAERVNAVFGSIRYWSDDMEWPAIDVQVDGAKLSFSSAALAHARVAEGQATACIPLPGRWRGPLEVIVDGHTERVHFVADSASHRAFFRDALDVERRGEAGLAALSEHAFPDLCFLPGVWDGVRHFQGGYSRVRDALHRLLAVLDDHGAWVYGDRTGRLSPDEPAPPPAVEKPITDELIMARFRGWGLVITPENIEVRNDGHYRRARERSLGGETLYCEWHYKLERHINRVHIHPPRPVSGGRVVVAIFRDHLPLPGD
jgi:hypothetical protein